MHRHNSTGAIGNGRPPLPSQHRHSYMDGRDHHTMASAAARPDPIRHGSSWQSESNTPQLRSPPQGARVTHLRGPGAAEGLPSQPSPTPPMAPALSTFSFQNAANAMDALTVHCQESNWRWIEGLLLGGSFAYAMGNYEKACEWYSKILSIDPK
jgi:hypothetical protein